MGLWTSRTELRIKFNPANNGKDFQRNTLTATFPAFLCNFQHLANFFSIIFSLSLRNKYTHLCPLPPLLRSFYPKDAAVCVVLARASYTTMWNIYTQHASCSTIIRPTKRNDINFNQPYGNIFEWNSAYMFVRLKTRISLEVFCSVLILAQRESCGGRITCCVTFICCVLVMRCEQWDYLWGHVRKCQHRRNEIATYIWSWIFIIVSFVWKSNLILGFADLFS